MPRCPLFYRRCYKSLKRPMHPMACAYMPHRIYSLDCNVSSDTVVGMVAWRARADTAVIRPHPDMSRGIRHASLHPNAIGEPAACIRDSHARWLSEEMDKHDIGPSFDWNTALLVGTTGWYHANKHSFHPSIRLIVNMQ